MERPNAEWYVVCLTGRPLTERGRCTLGRETLLEELVWEKGDWPRLKVEGRVARQQFDLDHKIDFLPAASIKNHGFGRGTATFSDWQYEEL